MNHGSGILNVPVGEGDGFIVDHAESADGDFIPKQNYLSFNIKT